MEVSQAGHRPKNKDDKLLDKYRYKTSFEKDQKKHDTLFEYEAKQEGNTHRAQVQ